MFQMLVVDDEAAMVDSIVDTIPWQTLNIEQVFKAYSAYEALELLHKHTIDIVITDIRMPDMDGLELIEKIGVISNKTKCIILSGYSEFEYAKKALQAHTEDYLLKPISDAALMEAVQRVLAKLEAEWAEVNSLQHAIQTLKENLPMLREGLLNDLLQGRLPSDEAMQEKISMLNIRLQMNQAFSILLVRLEEPFTHYDEHSLSLMEFAVANMADEIFSPFFDLWSCKDAHNHMVLLLKANPSQGHHPAEEIDSEYMLEKKVERLANELQRNVELYLKGSVSVVVGKTGIFPFDVSSTYRQAITALRKNIGNDCGLFIRVADFQEQTNMFALQALYEPPLLVHLFEAGRWDEAKVKLTYIFDELSAMKTILREHMLEVYYCIASAFCYIAHQNGKALSDIVGADALLFSEGNDFYSLQTLRRWVFEFFEQVAEDMRTEMKHSRNSIIKKVQDYIDNHLSMDVSLPLIADQVFLHPAYLSKVFKLETGDSFTEYVFRVRMRKAVYLLKYSELKIYEITEQVGYRNAPYFIKVFKKHHGLTPQEFREGRRDQANS